MDKFEQKLNEWYGNYIERSEVRLLIVDEVDGTTFSKTYMVAQQVGKNTKQVEFARIFTIGDRMEISIDLKIHDLNNLDYIASIVEYGQNTKGMGIVLPF